MITTTTSQQQSNIILIIANNLLVKNATRLHKNIYTYKWIYFFVPLWRNELIIRKGYGI